MNQKNKSARRLLFSLLFFIHFFGILYVFFPSLHDLWQRYILGMGLVKAISYFFIFLFSISYLVSFRNQKSVKGDLGGIALSGMGISLLAIIVSYLLIVIERSQYPNFLYSHFHLDVRSLPEYLKIQYILLGIFLIGVLKVETLVTSPLSLKVRRVIGEIVSPSIILAILSLALIMNVLKGFRGSLQAEVNYYRINGNSIDERGKVVDLPEFKKQTDFIAAYTPEDAVIVHPLPTFHYLLGSQVMLRYFLYPRFLVSSVRLEAYEKEGHPIDKAYYILTKHHTEEKYYPEESFLASSILVLYKDGVVIKYARVNFNQKFIDSLGEFEVGLIQK